MSTPLFVTMEGPDGSGKTTQAKRLVATLTARGIDALYTREPGGTKIGQQVRQVLMDLGNTGMVAEAEFLLFSASRAQLVQQVIRPHLAGGGVVVCDRFYDSSLAYQGHGHGLDVAAIRTITGFATGGLVPDLTLLFDVPPDVGLQRRRTAEEWTRLDDMALAFHNRVYAGFKALAEAEPARWRVVNAQQPLDAIAAEVWHIVAAVLDLPADG